MTWNARLLNKQTTKTSHNISFYKVWDGIKASGYNI